MTQIKTEQIDSPKDPCPYNPYYYLTPTPRSWQEPVTEEQIQAKWLDHGRGQSQTTGLKLQEVYRNSN
jgi:hypothetical protein